MSSTTAFACDGPACDVLAHRDKGTRAPAGWPRVTLKVPSSGDGIIRSGAFHALDCALEWLDAQYADLGINTTPVED